MNFKTDFRIKKKPKSLPRSSKPQISTIVRPLTTALDQQKRPSIGKKSKTTFREARQESIQIQQQQQQEEDQLQQQDNSARDDLQNGDAEDVVAALMNESEVLVREDTERRNSMSDVDNDDFLNDDKWDTDIEKEGESLFIFFLLEINFYPSHLFYKFTHRSLDYLTFQTPVSYSILIYFELFCIMYVTNQFLPSKWELTSKF